MRSSFLWIVLTALALLTAAHAEPADLPGVLQGIIVDGETGETLIGVNVQLSGTARGSSTDLDGVFRVTNIPAGTYDVVATALGYARVTVRNVQISNGKTEVLNLKMTSEAVGISEILVEATQVDNTEASLLSIQKKAAAVSDGISAEQIRKSTDSDASGAVKRVTGVTIVGDKYVYVRGMGERYNNTRLNGAAIASPEPLKRTVPFDIIPANLLDNVIVSKTATPDQPGDFAGGSVQLNTREFPDKLIFTVSATNGYNSQTSLKGFNSYAGGNKDWLAIDDGTRAIPGYLSRGGWLGDPAREKSAAQSFKNYSFGPAKTSAPLNGSRSLSFGNQSEVLGRPLGYLVSLNYADSYSRRTGEQNDYTLQQQSDGTSRYDIRQNMVVDRSVHSVNWGGILDLNSRINANHKLSLKSLYTRSADDEVRIANGTVETNVYRNYRLTWTERSLLTSQLKGEHELPAVLDSRLEWTGAYSRGTFDQPDRRDLSYAQDQGSGEYRVLFSGASGIRRFASMRDDVYEGMLDWTVPLDKFGAQNSKLKIGGLYRTMDRAFPTSTYYFMETTDPSQPQMDHTLPPEALFSDANIRNNFRLDVQHNNLDSYNADMKVAAGYLMGDLMLGTRWRLIGGLRVEDTDQHYKTFPYPGSTEADFSEGGPKHTDVLPSLNITYKVNDRVNLRAAASQTIANPDYAEIVPSIDQEFIQGREREGNPKIKHTQITNVDLRADYYPSVGENVSFGLFFKDLRDPIEWVLTSSGNAQLTTRPENFARAKNLGAELEFRKSLAFLAPKAGEWISFFSLIGNAALISSNVKLTNGGQNVLTNKSRPLIEQSRYVVNGTLAFDQPVWGTGVRLGYNTFGKRISAVGAVGLDDTYEMPFDKLDLSVNQRLSAHWAVKAQATNLLNSTVEFKSRSYIVQKYRIGRTLSAGFSYSL
jgi:outer membrane receptor protein involved in Fe transport